MRPVRRNLLSFKSLSASASAKTRLLADGDRLFFRIQPSGAQSWVFVYEMHGHQRRMGLGPYPTVTLAAAREAADVARRQIASGIDPLDARKNAAAVAKVEMERKRIANVREAMTEWQRLELAHAHTDGGGSVMAGMEIDALPLIGDMPPHEVTLQDILKIGDRIRRRATEKTPLIRTRNVVLSNLRQFYTWAISRNLASLDPTATISKIAFGGRDGEGDRTLSVDELVWLLARVEAETSRQIMAFCLLLLSTGNRPGETCAAEWSEIDFEKGMWVIPAAHRKGNKLHPAVDHYLPLSNFACATLASVQASAGISPYLFPGPDGHPLDPESITKATTAKQTRPDERTTHKNQLSTVLLPVGGRWTPHDLRRTARTMLAGVGVPEEIAERCIGHYAFGKKIKRIYDRHKYENEMRAAMNKLGARLEEIFTPQIAPAPARKKVVVARKNEFLMLPGFNP
jgi:integrase